MFSWTDIKDKNYAAVDDTPALDKVIEGQNLGQWHQVCMLEEYVEDNYYARFDICSCHRY